MQMPVQMQPQHSYATQPPTAGVGYGPTSQERQIRPELLHSASFHYLCEATLRSIEEKSTSAAAAALPRQGPAMPPRPKSSRLSELIAKMPLPVSPFQEDPQEIITEIPLDSTLVDDSSDEDCQGFDELCFDSESELRNPYSAKTKDQGLQPQQYGNMAAWGQKGQQTRAHVGLKALRTCSKESSSCLSIGSATTQQRSQTFDSFGGASGVSFSDATQQRSHTFDSFGGASGVSFSDATQQRSHTFDSFGGTSGISFSESFRAGGHSFSDSFGPGGASFSSWEEPPQQPAFPVAKESAAAPPAEQQAPHKLLTTLMIRNVPEMYTSQMLLEEWPNKGTYDFLYLPYDTAAKCNRSYAFMNFTTEEAASAFYAYWQNRSLAHFAPTKLLDISFAKIQGLAANLKQISKKRVGRMKAPQSQPLVFKNGRQYGSLAEVEAGARNL